MSSPYTFVYAVLMLTVHVNGSIQCLTLIIQGQSKAEVSNLIISAFFDPNTDCVEETTVTENDTYSLAWWY